MPWAQAIQAKDCTIIFIADFLRIAIHSRVMIFSMRQQEALHYRSLRFEIDFDGGPGADGNAGRLSWQPVIGSSRTFSISERGRRSKP